MPSETTRKELAEFLKKGLAAYQNREYQICIELLDRFCHESKSDVQRKAVEITLKKATEMLSTEVKIKERCDNLINTTNEYEFSSSSESLDIVFLAGAFDQVEKYKSISKLISHIPKLHLILDFNQVECLDHLYRDFQSIIISPNKLNGFGTVNYTLANFPLLGDERDVRLNIILSKANIHDALYEDLFKCKLIHSTKDDVSDIIMFSIRVNHRVLEDVGYILPFSFDERDQQQLPSLLFAEYVLRYCETFSKTTQATVTNNTDYIKLKKTLVNCCEKFVKCLKLSQQSIDIIEYVRLSIRDRLSRSDFVPINIKTPAQLLSFIKNRVYSDVQTGAFDIVFYVTDEFEKAVGESTDRLNKNKLGVNLINATKMLQQYNLNNLFFLSPCKLDFKIDYDQFVKEAVPPVPITYAHLIPSGKSAHSVSSPDTTFSIIMSYYNSSDSIWYALFSTAIQTLKCHEIMIGDDCSEDSAKRVLSLLRWLYPSLPIKIIENDCNIGTYATRNRLILESTGEWIVINDSDDFSLRNRLKNQYFSVQQNGAQAVYSNHARISIKGNIVAFISPQGEIKTRRPSMASYFYQSSLHARLGYYFSYKKGCDSEWHHRLVGEGVTQKLLSIELLQACDLGSEKHLTSDMFVQRSSVRYLTLYQSGQSTERQQIDLKLKSHMSQLQFVRPLVQNVAFRKVVGNMATIPKRLKHLEQVLVAILPQVDQFNLYLNNFSDDFDIFDACPGIISYKKNIILTKSQEIGDRREHARFTKIKQYDSGWYFVCFDDDIIYPKNYVDKLVFTSTLYGDRVALCVHGYSLWDNLISFTSDTSRQSRYFHFKEALNSDSIVDVAGVGTFFAPAELIDTDFAVGPFGFNDLVLADYLFHKRIPIFAVARHKGWLCEIKYDDSLFKEAKRDDSPAQLFAIELQQRIGVWERDFCNLNEIIGVNRTGLYSRAPSLLSREQDKYPIYICVTGFNASKYIKNFCESLRVALINVFSANIHLLFLDDHSSDDTGAILHDECIRRLGRYKWNIVTTQKREGPAVGRAYLLNEVRREVGKKLVVMLDLDDSVSPFFGRYLTQVIQQGFCHKIYCGGWFFGGKTKRPWQAVHGMTGDRIDSLAQMPFSWQHVRMWWEDIAEEMNYSRLRIGFDGILYCSDVAFFMALKRELPNNTVVSRSYDHLYSYVHDNPGGTIANYGPIKNATACYLLINR